MKAMEAFKMLLILCSIGTSTALDTISPVQFITDGKTIVSADESFEFGFFSPGSSKNRYLGIWYKKISTGTVVWVANRETPLSDHSGVLKMTSQGTLVLLNSTKDIIWQSNSSRTLQKPVAQLLDSGNLVVRDGIDSDPRNYAWQSFDYPCDTLLPDMRLGTNLATGHDWFMTSWKSNDDPAPGDFSVWLDTQGSPQLVLKKGSTWQYRGGPWNGLSWTGTPALQKNPLCYYVFVTNKSEISYKFEFRNSSVVSKLVIQPSGDLRRFTWIDRTHSWKLFYSSPIDQCDSYAFCGAYGKCNINGAPTCTCLEGFAPKSPKDWALLDWSDGCVRKAPLECPGRDGFLTLKGMKLPDTAHSWVDKSIGLRECEQLCSKNCSCTAYANSGIEGGGNGCLLWFHDLIDMKEFTEGGQDIYIRLSASELARIEAKKRVSEKRKVGIIISCLGLSLVMGILILGALFLIRKKRLQKQEMTNNSEMEDSNDDTAEENGKLTTFDLDTIKAATDNFSCNNKLGEGGFGHVYKGALMDGTEIAVKRLSKSSGQGKREFKNEVILIAKLQHRNLVKLLGCCIQGDERMLIYEYMSNKSLDSFIFDQRRSKLLDWRKRFDIIGGIARGLLYLHQDSRLKIIHRDLKASNVLLDSNKNPKISDFGLAKTFGRDQSVANTNSRWDIVSHSGYMSPEYAIDGLFSVKSDVYSFGVLVLEIVSGKRNRGFSHSGHGLNLIGHAWRQWIEKRSHELVHDLLYESCDLSQVLRCIHVGLLCVQCLPEDRPNMSEVVLMLGSDTSLPQPKQPGFYAERNPLEAESSSSKEDTGSRNEMTATLLVPR